MKSSKELREEIGRLSAEVQALVQVAEEESRDLTAEENAQVEANATKIGESGDKPTGLWAQVVSAEKRERIIAASTKPKTPETEPKKLFAEPKSAGKLVAFQNTRDAYNAGRWFQAAFHKDPEVKAAAREYCREHGIGIQAAQTEASGGAGAYLVPNPVSDAIVRVREQVGVARRVSRIVPMTVDSLDIPKESTGQTVYYPSQAAAITASDMAWGVVSLSAVKRATLTAISNELIGDALVDVMDEVANRAGYQLALQEDNEFINGDGTSNYGGETGLITACLAGGKLTLATDSTFASLTLANLSTVMGLIAEKYWNDANMAWIMRRDTYVSVIEPLTFALGGNSNLTFANGVPTAMLKGYPVYFTDRMPTTAASKAICFFGNFRDSVVIGDRQQISMAMSSDYGFNVDATYVRLTARYDINVHSAPAADAEGGYAGIFTGAAS